MWRVLILMLKQRRIMVIEESSLRRLSVLIDLLLLLQLLVLMRIHHDLTGVRRLLVPTVMDEAATTCLWCNVLLLR